MCKLNKILFSAFVFLVYGQCALSLEIENTADNPRLVNLSPKQFRTLDVIEKRVYHTCFYNDNTVDRIERLEEDMFGAVQPGNPSTRLATLRLESTKAVLRGTPMTPMMSKTFNTKYINASSDIGYHDDVGIIDGLIRVWWPNFYERIEEYRKFKEANFN